MMNKYINFLIDHWILTSIFITALLAWVVFEVLYSEDTNAISPADAINLINHEHAVIIDLRTKEQFAQSKILGAINLELQDLSNNQKKKQLEKYIKKPIILVSNAQSECKRALKLLQQQQFARIHYLHGGLQAWHAAGLPLEK